jgi:membrane fusion protein (multidrug efflux system)
VKRLATGLLGLALLASGCQKQPEDTAADFRASVVTAPVKRGRIERTIVTTGTVRAVSSAKAVTEAAGRLTIARNPRTGNRWSIGDEIRRGETIAVIAPDDLAIQARLDARRQAVATTRADHARYKSLHEQGLLSALQMAEHETRLANAEADLRSAELQQSKSRLAAPISGVVTTVTTSPDGELVTERQSLAEIMELDDLVVDLDLGAGDILDVQPQQAVRVGIPGTDVVVEGTVARVAPAIDPKTRTFRVEVALDAQGTAPRQDAGGGVASQEPGRATGASREGAERTASPDSTGIPRAGHGATVDAAGGRVPPAGFPQSAVRPGMFVRAEIVAESRENVLLVPSSAVVVREGSPAVFVVEAQRALRRNLSPGLVTEDVVEVVEGVSEGQLVVVSGQETLDDNAKVVVRE